MNIRNLIRQVIREELFQSLNEESSISSYGKLGGDVTMRPRDENMPVGTFTPAEKAEFQSCVYFTIDPIGEPASKQAADFLISMAKQKYGMVGGKSYRHNDSVLLQFCFKNRSDAQTFLKYVYNTDQGKLCHSLHLGSETELREAE